LPAVLLVDDNAANLVALEAILMPLGYRTVKARSGEEALKHLLQEDFTVILLDVQMPGMDGFEAASAIKAHPRTADIPIIFVTAISREASHIFKGYAHGAVDYLLKPFEPEVLRAKVSIFVDLHRKDAKIRAQAALLHQHELRRVHQRSEERYRDLSDSMPLPMWRVRKDGAVCTSNRASLQYTGFEAEREANLVSDELVHADDIDRVRKEWADHTRALAPFDLECRLRRADGARRWHLLRVVPERPIRGSRTTDNWLVTATDTDAQRSAFEAAEAANRMKDEFLATVSHELRTPLNAILGWARMLADGMLDPKTSVRAIEVIERSARTQAELINDILDVSRITSGNLRLQIAPVNLSAVIEDAIEITQRAAQVKGIDVQFRCDSVEDAEAFGDPARMQQVIWNLVSNAIKFTDKGGTVEVRLVRNDAVAEICVRDSGQGIAPDFLPHVFDRFRQADSSASRTSAGLGLGLAIVRHLVELHGGVVRAESAGLGQGSTFTVTLPVGALTTTASPPRWFQSTRSTVTMLRPTRLDGMKVL
ncbi:MAG: ATP-binding protein, partial [Polyangiaceae bacterium]